jgi:decaprenylphospho-beta-D-ribofuranose 2-oxidase
MPGWTLAADVPAAVPGLLEILDELDKEVAAAGGRLYLAKDSRMSSKMFNKSYTKLENWSKNLGSFCVELPFNSDSFSRLCN